MTPPAAGLPVSPGTKRRVAAGHLDPTRGPSSLAQASFDVEPAPDDLRPFLEEWRPHRPQRDVLVSPRLDAAAAYPGVLDELIPQAWHHIERGATYELVLNHTVDVSTPGELFRTTVNEVVHA